jgi:hypothetical protein
VRQLTGVQRRAVMGLLVLAGLPLVVDFTPKRVHTPCGGVATSNGIPYWEGARNLYGVAAVSITGLVVYLWFRARRPIEEDEAT